ncbi:MAG: DNA mismatch repair endonuclease MutL [Pirellulales bacterium]|nr:DNA mismatch repair endonuclease MutL [Pirellulales bacterium]
MGRICQLSATVVNQIAAGEVIERPASVIKELVENSLDAGATRVDVAVVRGGVELVRVTDNGHGIDEVDLPLALASHATSKLHDADDLFRVATLGFRGEALASIASISRLILRSRTPVAAAGAEITAAGGTIGQVAPCGCSPGTTIEVAELFYNTPVRRKFLRSTQTEIGHVVEALTRLALAHPRVHFTLRHNDREVLDLPPVDPWLVRIERLLGQELASHWIWVESSDDSGGGVVRLSGYVAHPSQSRSNARSQYLFLNGRFIRDRALGHALQEAYRGLLLTGRYPISCLQFEMPAEMVDVNVHPTKLEVRFQDAGRLYSQLLSTLRTKFLTTDLTTELNAARAGGDASMESAAGRVAPVATAPSATLRQPELEFSAVSGRGLLHPGAAIARDELVAWAKDEVAGWNRSRASDETPSPAPNHAPLTIADLPRAWSAVDPHEDEHEPVVPGANGEGTRGGIAQLDQREGYRVDGPATVTTAEANGALAHRPALQLHNRYLIAETADGMAIIDQHALHERVLYEQLRDKVLASAVETQSLLVPEPVDLAASEAALVLEHRELLARLGVQVEPFGGGTLLIVGYPAILANLRPVEILRGLVEQLASGARQPQRRDLLDEMLHMVACKAAVKAGDRLSTDEVHALLEMRGQLPDTHHCPHGRPTELVFTREELDRQFKRT